MSTLTTWRKKITQAMESHKETFADIVSSTFKDGELDVEFDDGFGGTEGIEFTVWTTNRVYFPTEYDGSEGVASVARNPDGKPTRHSGD